MWCRHGKPGAVGPPARNRERRLAGLHVFPAAPVESRQSRTSKVSTPRSGAILQSVVVDRRPPSDSARSTQRRPTASVRSRAGDAAEGSCHSIAPKRAIRHVPDPSDARSREVRTGKGTGISRGRLADPRELYEGSRPAQAGRRLVAASGAIFDLKTNARRPNGWTFGPRGHGLRSSRARPVCRTWPVRRTGWKRPGVTVTKVAPGTYVHHASAIRQPRPNSIQLAADGDAGSALKDVLLTLGASSSSHPARVIMEGSKAYGMLMDDTAATCV